MKLLICNFKIFYLTENFYSIGRGQDNDIRTDDKTVSRQACCLLRSENQGWILIDGTTESHTKNKNGCFLNGKQIQGFAKLKDGDSFYLSENFYFKLISTEVKTVDEKSTIQLLDKSNRAHDFSCAFNRMA